MSLSKVGSPLAGLIGLLWRNSSLLFIATILVGVASGGVNALIIGLVHNVTVSRSSVSTIERFGILLLLTAVARLASQICAVLLAQRTMFDLVLEISNQIMRASLEHLECVGISQILAALTDDVTSLTNGLIAFVNIGLNTAIVLACCIYLCFYSPIALGLGILVITASILVYIVCVRLADEDLKEARNQQGELFERFQALTAGAKELKLYHDRATSFIQDDLTQTAKLYTRYNLRGRTKYAIAGVIFQTLYFLMYGVLVFALPKYGLITNGVTVGALFILMFMMAPAGLLATSAPAIAQAVISLETLESLGLALRYASPDAAESPRATDLGDQPATVTSDIEIELRGVTYSYPKMANDVAFEVGPVDLKIRGGEVVFLVGGNGSGKTTVAKVLTGLYAPLSGLILWNGAEVSRDRVRDFRQSFAVVFSDGYIFPDVSAAVPDCQLSRIKSYLQYFQLEKSVRLIGRKWSTTRLSQGQRKRLALIDAMLSDRRVFVLDEWAAEQDPEFRELFYTSVIPEMLGRKKAVVVISHDDAYFHIASKILYFDRGRVTHSSSGLTTKI